jgi:cytochrome c
LATVLAFIKQLALLRYDLLRGAPDPKKGERMSSIELNKIFAACLLAGIIAMTSGFVADILVEPEHLAKNAYHIVTAASAVNPISNQVAAATSEHVVSVPPISPLLAHADPVAGQAAARVCSSCHTFDRDGSNRVGPNLWNVIGNPRARVAGFNYSPAMRGSAEAGATWSFDDLNEFLSNPRQYLPGTRMSFPGERNDQTRANIIAYLQTLSNSPVPLPTVNTTFSVDPIDPTQG